MITVRLIGTAASIPTRERGLPATLIDYKNSKLLFDCGEGTQRQLMSEGLKFMRIDQIFITHWHADHFAGLTGLIQTMSLDGREKKLDIYGPPETTKFVKQIIGVGHFGARFDIGMHDIQEGDIIEGNGYKVIPFWVEHRIPSLGYVFQEDDKLNADMKKAKKFGLTTGPLIGKLKAGKTITVNGKKVKPKDVIDCKPGKKIVITGDTMKCKNVVKYAKGADLLIHDSTYSLERKARAPEVKHSTSTDAAETAKKAKVDKLVLTHISRRYQQKGTPLKPEDLLKEAKKVFKNTVLAEDMMKIVVK